MKLLSVGFQAVLTVVLFLDRTDRFFKSQITKVYYVWTQLTLVLLLLFLSQQTVLVFRPNLPSLSLSVYLSVCLSVCLSLLGLFVHTFM